MVKDYDLYDYEPWNDCHRELYDYNLEMIATDKSKHWALSITF